MWADWVIVYRGGMNHLLWAISHRFIDRPVFSQHKEPRNLCLLLFVWPSLLQGVWATHNWERVCAGTIMISKSIIKFQSYVNMSELRGLLNTIKYNWVLISPCLHLSSEVHLHASAAQMQWYCRAVVCEELAQGLYTVTVSDEARTRTLRITGRAL